MKNSCRKLPAILLVLALCFLASACAPIASYRLEDHMIRLKLPHRWDIEHEPDGITASCKQGCFQNYKDMPDLYIGRMSADFETPDDIWGAWQQFVRHDPANPDVLEIPQTDSLAGFPAVHGTLAIERTFTVSPMLEETAIHIRHVWVVNVEGSYLFIVGNMSFAARADYQSPAGAKVSALIDRLIRSIDILPVN